MPVSQRVRWIRVMKAMGFVLVCISTAAFLVMCGVVGGVVGGPLGLVVGFAAGLLVLAGVVGYMGWI